MILSGDMTGKANVLIAHEGSRTWRAILLQHEFKLEGDDEVAEMEKKIKSRSYYS